MEIASPKGGQVVMDALSDPRDASGYSAHDLVTMGFVHTPACAALLESTKRIADCRVEDYDAVLVTGGQSPMFTFRQEPALIALGGALYATTSSGGQPLHPIASWGGAPPAANESDAWE